MNSKNFKLIFLASLFFSIAGIALEIYNYILYITLEPGKAVSFEFIWYFRAIYLNLGFHNAELNIYNIIFYVILFFGAIFFYISQGKETRLIRFFYSILILNCFVLILRMIFYNLINYGEEIDFTKKIFRIIIGLAVNSIYIFIAFKVLRTTLSNRILDSTEKVVAEKLKKEITETSSIERFLHHIIDTLMIIFMLFLLVDLLVDFERYNNIKMIPDLLNNQFGFLIIVFLMRFIYFPFFEKTFGSSPAKFLTNSLVVNPKTETPSLNNILERTLYRHIPLDSFSFLFGKGWHDSISKTYVVKEKNEGLNSVYIVGVFIFCSVLAILYIMKFVNF